jgi:hypothetical protein
MFLWPSASLMIALKTNFPEPALPAPTHFLHRRHRITTWMNRPYRYPLIRGTAGGWCCSVLNQWLEQLCSLLFVNEPAQSIC